MDAAYISSFRKPPYGALAEKSLVRKRQCVPLPDGLDDKTAAAIANPGMSALAALLVERAHLKPGDTVLVNGATGTAGALAVQLAKYLGAGKVIATGRNEVELQSLLSAGADVAIPFMLGMLHPRERHRTKRRSKRSSQRESMWFSIICGARARRQLLSPSQRRRRTQHPCDSCT